MAKRPACSFRVTHYNCVAGSSVPARLSKVTRDDCGSMITTNELKVLPSVCPLDCPDACALEITFDGERMVKLSGAEHPVTRGFACVKMAKYPQRQEHADRLLVPQRTSGQER